MILPLAIALGDGALLREQTADSLLFYQAVYVLTAASRLDRAAAFLADARAEALARGSQVGFAQAALFLSWVELCRGRVGEAEAETAAYRKLGVDSRQGLRDIWSRRPDVADL